MSSTAVLAAAVAGAASLGAAAPAYAAPGDASARGVVVNLAGSVAGVPVIAASNTSGSATAPAGGGTDSSTNVPVLLPGALGVTATGNVNEVTATRGSISSSARSRVSNFGLGILGIPVVTATEATATVNCPFGGAQTAGTTVQGLQLFGAPVVLNPNTSGVNGSAPVVLPVPGVAGASLNVVLTRTETTTANTAAATAILATVTLTGQLLGVPFATDVGTVIVAQAQCQAPAAPAAPAASSISPNSGPQSGGQTVTITGTNFIAGAGNTTVTFGGIPATNVVVAPGGASLTAVTPAHTVGPVPVVVTTAGGSTAPLTYTYLADGSGVIVTGLTPTSGPTSGGTVVTITGSGFTGATGVTFGGTPGTSFSVNPVGTTITVTTPPHDAGGAPVVITFPAGATVDGSFTFVAPTIGSIIPNQGPSAGGTVVTITGTGFTGATAVTFRGVAGTNLVVDPSGTALTVTTPAGPVGPVDVVVVLPGPDAVAPNGFTYLLAAPTIGSVTPDRGSVQGGFLVTINGSGFVPDATSVTICGTTIPASAVNVSPGGTTATFIAPRCAAGLTTITVTTPGGTSNAVPFRYVADGLPVTGSSIGQLLLIGASMIGAGALALLLIRRRPARRSGLA